MRYVKRLIAAVALALVVAMPAAAYADSGLFTVRDMHCVWWGEQAHYTYGCAGRDEQHGGWYHITCEVWRYGYGHYDWKCLDMDGRATLTHHRPPPPSTGALP